MAYYLKYRPQKIEELDNENVRQILTSVLKQKDIPHAFLFTGPKGLGKTSSARIVAKAVNCLKNDGKSIEPCNDCEMCRSITNGSHMDIMEIDAASNRGIDEIRDLREKIRLAPTSARKKVYIIDEVHMLTTEAFNALLKTLEEPPKHAMFVLATTEPHKVPETIISRCLHIPFSKATPDELKRSFTRIAKGESLEIDEIVLAEIARLSDGGFRDGVKILEELVSLAGGKKITADILENRFHTKSIDQAIEKLLTVFLNKDISQGFDVTRQLSTQGVDFQYILQTLIGRFHQIMLVKTKVAKDTSLEKFAHDFSYDQLVNIFDILSNATSDMKYTVISELPLELAIIEYSEKSTDEITSDIEERVEKIAKDVTVKSLRKEVGQITRKQLLSSEPEKKSERQVPANTNGNLLSFKTDGDVTEEWLSDFWQAIITKMKDHNHTVAGVMRGCHIRSFDRKSLVIETKFKFHKDKLGDEKTITILETICKNLTGNPIQVSVELGN